MGTHRSDDDEDDEQEKNEWQWRKRCGCLVATVNRLDGLNLLLSCIL